VKSVYIGFVFYIIGFILFSIASQGWMMFAFMVPYALGGLAGPSIQSIISGKVPPNEQGELQGAITSLISITSIVGPILMTGLFAYFSSKESGIYFPGAPFLMGAVLTVISFILAAGFLRKENPSQ
jgi:DHA1 family tetracycline resistance protein-like MFS transporter